MLNAQFFCRNDFVVNIKKRVPACRWSAGRDAGEAKIGQRAIY